MLKSTFGKLETNLNKYFNQQEEISYEEFLEGKKIYEVEYGYTWENKEISETIVLTLCDIEYSGFYEGQRWMSEKDMTDMIRSSSKTDFVRTEETKEIILKKDIRVTCTNWILAEKKDFVDVEELMQALQEMGSVLRF